MTGKELGKSSRRIKIQNGKLEKVRWQGPYSRG